MCCRYILISSRAQRSRKKIIADAKLWTTSEVKSIFSAHISTFSVVGDGRSIVVVVAAWPPIFCWHAISKCSTEQLLTTACCCVVANIWSCRALLLSQHKLRCIFGAVAALCVPFIYKYSRNKYTDRYRKHLLTQLIWSLLLPKCRIGKCE